MTVLKLIPAHEPKRKGGGLGYKKRLIARWLRIFYPEVKP